MYILLTIVVILFIFFVIICNLKARWNMFDEGVVVYRCLHGSEQCNRYSVIVLGGHKYLINVNRCEPYIRYDFQDYIKDLREHRVYTEEQVDSFD